MTTNADKFQFLTSTWEEVIVKTAKEKKTFKKVIDNRLTFKPHVENLCKKSRTETSCTSYNC